MVEALRRLPGRTGWRTLNGKRGSRLSTLTAWCLVSLGGAFQAEARVEVSPCRCQESGLAGLCIDWEADRGAFLEVRCPSREPSNYWARRGAPETPISRGAGTFLGTYSLSEKIRPYPGEVLRGALRSRFLAAHQKALNLLRYDDECRKLFEGNRLGLHPVGLMMEKIEYRNGEDAKSGRRRPCKEGIGAWVPSYREHSPYVMLCSGFRHLETLDAARLLVHEALHVAGQAEDRNGTVGPGDPPSSAKIDELVQRACDGK